MEVGQAITVLLELLVQALLRVQRQRLHRRRLLRPELVQCRKVRRAKLLQSPPFAFRSCVQLYFRTLMIT